MTDIWLLYSTFAQSDEAFSAARMLLERRLVACANVFAGATSLYRWEGEIRQEKETVMIAKTTAGQVEAARQAVCEHHSYTVPCVVAWPVGAGHMPFLEWVEAQVEP